MKYSLDAIPTEVLVPRLHWGRVREYVCCTGLVMFGHH
jgi:hypothetical protein